MKKVWTDSQGTIHKPSPGASRSCFSRPVRRVELESATSTARPRTVSRVWFRTCTFNFEDYNTSNGCPVVPGAPIVPENGELSVWTRFLENFPVEIGFGIN